MADGGATQFIMLITALLISGAASAVLIDSWAGISDVMSDQHRKSELDSETEVSIAGDTTNVQYVTVSRTITLYFQNSGTATLDKDSTEMVVYVEGQSVSISSVSVLSGASEWYEGEVIKIVGTHDAPAHADNDEVSISMTVMSLQENSVVGTDTLYEIVRLDT